MPEDLSIGKLGVDIEPYLTALTKATDQTGRLNQAVLDGAAQQQRSFAEVAKQATAYSDAIARQQAEQRAAVQAAQSAREALRQLGDQQRDLAARLKKVKEGTDEYQRLQGLLEKNRLEIEKATQAYEENKAAIQESRTALEQSREAQRQAANEAKATAAAGRDIAAAQRQAAQQTKEQAAAEKQAAAEAEKEVRSAGLLVQLEAKLADLTERRARATTKAEAQGYTKEIEGVRKQISELTTPNDGGFFSSLLGKVTAASGGLLAFNNIVGRIKQGLNDFSALRGTQKALEAVSGSAAEGAREFSYIKEEANLLGLELIPTTKAYTGLFAAAKEANLSVATTRDIFEGVAGAAKVLNLSADNTNGVLLALQQIASKGTVASEELRGQIGERLPGAFGLAAKAMGLTTTELSKQLEQGRILAVDFLPKFAAQLKATYGGAMADAATEVGANTARITSFLSGMSARVGASVAPYVAVVAALVTPTKTLKQVAQESTDAYFRQAEATRALTQTVTPLLSRYEELSGITNRNAGQQQELDSIIQQLAKSVPGAVTEFDKYGKALDINRDAVRKFVAEQQNLTRYNNRAALADNSADLRRLLREQDALQKQLNNTVTDPATGLKRRQVAEAASGGAGGASAFVRTLSQAESDKITSDLTAQLTLVQQDVQANLANRERLRGYNPLLPKVPTQAEIEGLIEKQRRIIKDLQDRQVKATQENQGNGKDFLLGKGGLDEQLDAANKELDRLLGKVEKGRKARQYSYESQLRALLQEREMLTALAAKASEKVATNEADRARQVFEESLRQVELVRAKLVQREEDLRKAALRAGGQRAVNRLGEKADGVVDGVQDRQLLTLRVAALDTYYETLGRLERQRQQRIFDLQAESNAKEIEAVNRKYDALLEAQKLGQSAQADAFDVAAGVSEAKLRQRNQEELAIEAARQRDLVALRARQEQTRIDQTAQLQTANAQAVGQNFGAGTGISVYEAKRAEQKALLDIEKQAAQDSLNNTLNKTGKEAEIERAALRGQLARIDQQQKELQRITDREQFSIYKLVLGDQDNDENRRLLDEEVSQIRGAVNNIIALQQQQADAQIAARNQNISELQSQLAAQIQLNQQGSASNIKGLQDQLKAEKAARAEALAAKREAQKQAAVISQLEQAAALATAAANIIAGWSTIPIAGQILGAVSIAAMLASFIATKSAAEQAAQQQFFVGGFTEPGGPADKHTPAGIVHRGEFVANQELVRDYRPLFSALHEGKAVDWSHPKLAALLPDYSLPQQLRAEKQAHVEHTMRVSMEPLRADFAQLDGRLAAIEGHTKRGADRREVLARDNGFDLVDPATGSVNQVRIG